MKKIQIIASQRYTSTYKTNAQLAFHRLTKYCVNFGKINSTR